MQLNDRYRKIFGNTPIFGMLHLAGNNPVERALEEIEIFENEGVDAAIVENYHSKSTQNVIETLEVLSEKKTNVKLGLNILPNEFYISIPLAHQYNLDFVQLDHVSGNYIEDVTLPFDDYRNVKEKHSEVIVLGGVHPKYYYPAEGSVLEEDLKIGMQRAEAIVVTGEGTGMPTPLDKIIRFREVLGDHPLVVGAGLTPSNAYEQLCIADGAIVGSSLKQNSNTRNPIDAHLVREFMSIVHEVREYKKKRQINMV